jgi:hypothetical protein
MASVAGITQMGSQPVAGRARAVHVCVSGRSTAATAHEAWLLGTRKPATRMFIAVPDTNGTRRPRGLT